MIYPSDNVTQLLLDWSEGDKNALNRLIPLVEDELKRMARHYMKRERQGHLLQTTALVNEAYLRLVDQRRAKWQNRAHFFGIAAQLMRRILLDYAKSNRRVKRGGKEAQQISLSEVAVLSKEESEELISLDLALDKLAQADERKSKIVELRYFGGLSSEEVAEVMNISLSTVERDWSIAKAWLRREIGDGE
jgi:RNA polymerase sigma factor (TIGR02999 family)